jgi:hypothetical protein
MPKLKTISLNSINKELEVPLWHIYCLTHHNYQRICNENVEMLLLHLSCENSTFISYIFNFAYMHTCYNCESQLKMYVVDQNKINPVLYFGSKEYYHKPWWLDAQTDFEALRFLFATNLASPTITLSLSSFILCCNRFVPTIFICLE